MQYSMMNYSYFVNQVATFIYIPVNFTVIAVKFLFTDHITPEMGADSLFSLYTPTSNGGLPPRGNFSDSSSPELFVSSP